MAGGPRGRLRRATGAWLPRAGKLDAGEVVLRQRRVFILPTRAGLGFALLLMVLLIGSINYALGLGFGLTFLALSCALVDMVATYRNLAHLALQQGRAAPVFAGQEAQFELLVFNRTRLARYAIRADFAEVAEPRHVADILPGTHAVLTLSVPSLQRGWLAPARIKLSTRFPLGLFNAWSYWRPAMRVLVYPRPEDGAPPLPLGGGSGSSLRASGHDDFAGVRNYQAGDSPRQLAWRQIARLDPSIGGALVSKHFEGGGGDELVLDFDAIPATLDLELRLSRMTRWVLEAEGRALPYAFRLGALRFDAALGAAHQAACLRALALYGTGGGSEDAA
ncbi:DUF58 domain-containing protein [Massilia sp. HP4]|uniref:DUF58 domain-containing protein n=1 Tax=Massilia sp. HP4 TaxID=2562316 RepID=UPI0010BFFA4B|nr:DUF58 domain-containing protein [Massilia sp. HP4]